MLILAILLPPLYFLLSKKTAMFLITGAMFAVSCFLAMTVVMIPGALILWLIAAFAAIRHFRRREINKDMARHADMIASKMAEKMQETKAPPVITPKN